VRNECYSTKVFLITTLKELSHISDLPCLHTRLLSQIRHNKSSF